MLWIVLLFGLWNTARVTVLGRQLTLWLELGIQPDPRVRLVGALIWAILFLGAAAALWQRRPFIRLAIPILLLLYAIYELGLILVFAQTSLAWQGMALNAILYAVTILFSQWALGRKATQAYFAQSGKEEE